ncbi:acyl-CoA synthetase [Amycolatopsis keratiniphila]|uniref:Acyl-CoA synthetase n=1 Tax=Amycolatopsis keratiniphila subsp. keratiniphila TaxID=227715 RepID=A0A1W2LZL2_9PSEU|nr:acyl-CoA synthetase [Amycolatopsis keratiniphila]ONF72632.1 acyl-CoA synthetase [Amycolatopsis keratiniphila subsp. keratiniphila]
MTAASLWPRYAEPADLAAIEAVPLTERSLPESTYALLQRAAAWWPDHPATTVLPEAARWREPVRRTFGELLADVHRYANLLRDLGVRRGDAVALMSPNCADLVPATLAAQLAGVAAPLNGGLSRDHLGELLRLSGARVLITAGPELAPETWVTARTLAGELDVVLVLRPTGAAGAPAALPAIDGVRVGYLADLAAAHDAADFAGERPVASDLAALFHTGGTTGAPKLAAHTHANEVADAWMIAANSLLDAGSVVFAALPLFHVNALVVTLLAPLFKGQHAVWAGPLGYREPALYGEFWKIVEHHRIAAMSAVPTVYAVLAQCPVDADIASLRFAMVGASPLPAAVREGFQTHTGVTLVEGYGLTEATCASARSFPDAPRPGTVGQRLPYQRMKVVHPETREELPRGETGVLEISGPTVFPGYVVGRDENAYVLDGLGKLSDGWLNTGDLARLEADGFVHLAGRVKDLIIRGGHNIDPAMIEDALLTHSQVTAAGAVGRPDEHAGEVPVAYVTLTSGATATEADLVAWAADRVPERAAAPKAITVLDALPVTDVGKPYKLALRADATRRAIAEALAPFDGVTVDAVIEDGTVTATITLPSDVDESKVRATLGRYTVPTRLTSQGRP